VNIDSIKLKNILKKKGLSLSEALKSAGVSRTAYYSLVRQDDIMPRSLQRLTKTLNTNYSDLLRNKTLAERRIEKMFLDLNKIIEEQPGLNADTVRHTLLLLEKKPIDRLRRSLQRAQAKHLY
jgi:transcriptional regulator with XRE-family HTH domain